MSPQNPAQEARLEQARAALAAAEQAAANAPDVAPHSSATGTKSQDTDPYAAARKIVLRQLTIAPRSRQQLMDKLRERECAPEVAHAVLDRMTEVGLVDDAAFARMYTRSRQEIKGLSARAIGFELRDKGIAQEHIDAALTDVEPEAEREQARALAEKRLRAMHGLEPQVQMRRLAGFLGRKGYGAGVAYDVIRQVMNDAAEHRRD